MSETGVREVCAVRKGMGKWLLCLVLCAGLFVAVYFLTTSRRSETAAAPEAVATIIPTATVEPASQIPDNAVKLDTPGMYLVDGWLYALGDEGKSLREGAGNDIWAFDIDGRYTTGDGELDTYLADAMHKSGADVLTGDEALRAAYMYVKNNYHYKVKPEDAHLEENGSVGWVNERAKSFLPSAGGTCYGYAAAFGLMARCLGYEAHIIAGEINQYNEPHAFVVIPEDGTDYIYDVEMEDTRPERHEDMDLYRQENFQIYLYWYEPTW